MYFCFASRLSGLLLRITGDLDRSERDILNLRSQQNRFAERIALMQRLLKVQPVHTLHVGKHRKPLDVAYLGCCKCGTLQTSLKSDVLAGKPRAKGYISCSSAVLN